MEKPEMEKPKSKFYNLLNGKFTAQDNLVKSIKDELEDERDELTVCERTVKLHEDKKKKRGKESKGLKSAKSSLVSQENEVKKLTEKLNHETAELKRITRAFAEVSK